MIRKPDFQRELLDLIDRYLNNNQGIAEKVPSILTQIAIITGAERCVLMIQRGRKHDFDFIHYDSDPEGSLPPSGSFLRSSPKEQLPSSHVLSDVFFPDITEEQDVSQFGEELAEESWRRIGYSSAVRLALSLKGQVAGFLFLLSSEQLGLAVLALFSNLLSQVGALPGRPRATRRRTPKVFVLARECDEVTNKVAAFSSPSASLPVSSAPNCLRLPDSQLLLV